MTAWVDGAFVAPAAVPRPRAGSWAPFETMGAAGAVVPLWKFHLERLAATARRLGLPFAPTPALPAAATELLLHNGHAEDVLRLSLVPGAATVHVVLASRPRGPRLACVRLLPTVVPRPVDAPPGDLKVEPRTFYDAVRQQAQDGDADDGIVVGRRGVVRETAVGNLWLRIGGTWVTPALDGEVLPGIGRARLLAAARRRGVPVAERTCDLGDLHRAEALAQSNAVFGPRPAALLGAAVPGVAFVDAELIPLWQHAADD